MAQSIIPTDLIVGGTLSANSITLSASSVTDAKVAAAADIAATKLLRGTDSIEAGSGL